MKEFWKAWKDSEDAYPLQQKKKKKKGKGSLNSFVAYFFISRFLETTISF